MCPRIMFVLFLWVSLPAHAITVTEHEARQVAESWVASLAQANGPWSESGPAAIGTSGAITRLGQHIGYYVNVEPEGFVIVGPLKELAPVAAYSTRGSYLPDLERGFLAFVEDDLAEMLDVIEARLGSAVYRPDSQLGALTIQDYSPLWNELLAGRPAHHQLPRDPDSRYAPGTVLLETEWNQTPPYNNYVPDMGCDYSAWGFPPEFSNAWAGCVPVAGAQIMNYWSWPPLEEDIAWFDWDITCQEYLWQDWNAQFIDENGAPVSELSIYAVGTLIASIGDLAGADYGCDGTSTVECDSPGRDMLDAFEDHFYYDDDANCDWEASGGVFSTLVSEISSNRPVQYGSGGHAFVVDGWDLWGGVTQTVHIVYGQGGPMSGWWTMQNLLDRPEPKVDVFIKQIQPIGCQGATLPSGNQNAGPGIAAYRYINWDAVGINTVYTPGIHLQFLDGNRITGTGTGSDFLTILGDAEANKTSYLFARTKGHGGLKVMNGAVRLQAGGSIRIH